MPKQAFLSTTIYLVTAIAQNDLHQLTHKDQVFSRTTEKQSQDAMAKVD